MSEESSSSYTPPKFCPQCGVKVTREGARFCTKCGRDFTKSQTDKDQSQDTPPQVGNTTSSAPSAVPQKPGQQSSGQQPGSSTYTGSMEKQPYSETYPQQKRSEMVTPNDIRPATSDFFSTEELYIVLFFAIGGLGSHIMRYLLLFDEFPSLINILVPIPIYLIVVATILAVQKYFMRGKGVHVFLEADRFDYTRSFVFSSFFLTLLPPRFKIDAEKSNVPDKVYISKSGQHGMSYQEISRSQYVGQQVRPYMHMYSNVVIMILGFVFLLFYFNVDHLEFQRVVRIVTLFITSFVIVEVAPVFGRHNELSSEYGRIRTLLIFLANIVIFLLALLGETFFLALQERYPI